MLNHLFYLWLYIYIFSIMYTVLGNVSKGSLITSVTPVHGLDNQKWTFLVFWHPKTFKDTDFGTAAHATRASSVNKLTSTSKMYEVLSNTRCLCEDALNYFQLMDGKNQSGHIFDDNFRIYKQIRLEENIKYPHTTIVFICVLLKQKKCFLVKRG